MFDLRRCLDQPAIDRHRLNAEKLIVFYKLEQLSASCWTRVALAIGLLGLVIAQGAGNAFAEVGARKTAVDAALPAHAGAVKTLTAGDVRAELLTLGGGKSLTAGSGAFAQIRLSTDAAGKKGVTAEIVVEAEHGELASIDGAGVKTDSESKTMRARIEGLRKGRERALLVEVKLPGGGQERTTLKVTLRSPANPGKPGEPAAASEDATAISWSVKDCAGGYYGALQQIRDNAELKTAERWKEASKADGSLPKGWVFAPKEERRSRRRRARTDVTASTKSERAILAEAGKLARAGKDPALDRDGDLGWVLGKVATDLDTYLAQPTNPALCTGALRMTDYYLQRLSALAKRGERLEQLATDAKAMAQAKVEAAFAAVRELPEDVTGWSGVTPASAKSMTARTDGLTGMAISLAELAAVPADVLAKAREAKQPYEALIPIEEADIHRDGMPDAVRDAMRAAFTAIDAAARLDAIRQRHQGLQAAFDGRIKAIRDAHGKHCVCES
jgi:hypothetical protein